MASGYNARDCSPCSDSLSLRLRLLALTSPRTLSRRFMMQKVRNQAFSLRSIALSLLVGTRFQVLWTPLTGVLFTFPSRYSFTIGRQGVFRLTGWSPLIQAGLLVSRLTWDGRSARTPFRLRGSHPLWPAFPDGSSTENWSYTRSLYPGRVSSDGLACSAFARHYSRNRICFLFLEVLRCFTSLGSPQHAYLFSAWYGGITRRGFPHSDIAGSKPG